jgi:UPF0755 protein
MVRRWKIWALFIVLICAAIAGCAFFLERSLIPVSGGVEYFRVLKGDNVQRVCERLESQGLIRSGSGVLFKYRMTRPKGSLHAGVYAIDRSMRGDAILNQLLQTEPIHQWIIVRPGLWTRQLTALLASKGVGDEKSLLDAISNSSLFRKQLGFVPKSGRLDGYLFPDSYDFPPTMDGLEALSKMCETFHNKALARLGNLSAERLHEIVIVGSLVEKETRFDSERARIAGVIYNRLRIGMPLQIDATVTFALGKERRLSFADYKVQSAYNTYLHKGLPPGPICSPGLSSMIAAAHPEKHDYLFYVAKQDGHSLFSKTYADHLRQIEIARGRGQR